MTQQASSIKRYRNYNFRLRTGSLSHKEEPGQGVQGGRLKWDTRKTFCVGGVSTWWSLGILPGPLARSVLVPGTVGLVGLSNLWDEWVVGVGIGQERAN